MPRYKVEESVGGEQNVIIFVETPMKAIIKYLKTEVVNLTTGSWNWDFTVTELKKYKRIKNGKRHKETT